MRIGLIQPPYPDDVLNPEAVYHFIMQQLETLPTGLDLVVLPEYANCPGLEDRDMLLSFISKTSAGFTGRLADIARFKEVNLAACLIVAERDRFFNKIFLFDRTGQIVADYSKTHLTTSEKELGITPGTGAVVKVVDSLRIAFLTCFDIYYPEYVARLAADRPDLIIFPSYQRYETAEVIRTLTGSCAVYANAPVIRAAYAMSAAQTGGQSMVVDTSGRTIINAGHQAGLFVCDLNVRAKRRPDAARAGQYADIQVRIEQCRRPDCYRPAGPGIIQADSDLPYPRLNAHRGLSAWCPENSMAAFGAAIASGAREIELDICRSRDGELIVSHDDAVDRVADGTGKISQMTWEEICRFDIGQAPDLETKKQLNWQNIGFCRLDDVLGHFAGRVIINIEIKQYPDTGDIYPTVEKTIRLLEAFQCKKHAYIAGHRQTILAARQIDPKITICCMEGQNEMSVVENAIKYGCEKVQFFKPYCTDKLPDKVRLAHANGIICNMAWSDDVAETEKFLAMGIDCILTNNLCRLQRGVKGFCSI